MHRVNDKLIQLSVVYNHANTFPVSFWLITWHDDAGSNVLGNFRVSRFLNLQGDRPRS